MRRIKVVVIDNIEIKISALTLDQVEAYTIPVDKELPMEERLVAYQQKQYNLIATSLNNLEPEKPWDAKRIKAELDLVILTQLQNDILTFSGLKVVEDIPPGEINAAQSL